MTVGLGVAMGVNFANGFLNGIRNRNAALLRVADYRQQADIYRRNAALVRLNGARNEDIMRAQNRRQIASNFAAAGEAGMAESSTMISALATSAAMMEQNVLNARYQTESEAENYLYQSRVAEENMRRAQKKSKNAFRSGLISGINSAFNLLGSNE